MNATAPRWIPMGERAILLRFGEEISLETNRRVHAVCRALDRKLPAGVTDLVPSYASLLVVFNSNEANLAALRTELSRAVAQVSWRERNSSWRWEIPVVYGGTRGPDLETVARALSLSQADVVRLHAATTYRVFALGFAPGFGYLGVLPEELRLPRRAEPRDRIPAGSVAMAERQTAVFPLERPAGWHILGWTPVRMFRPGARHPFVLAPGDAVQFRAVGSEEEAHDLTDRFVTSRWKSRPRPAASLELERSLPRTPLLRVVEAGHRTTIQDLGRAGAARYGMPAGGAMDPEALRMANLLAGNPEDAAALESVWKGPTLEAMTDCWVGLAGAMTIPQRDGAPVASPGRVRLRRGQRLRVGNVVSGLHIYVAVSGGFTADRFLGSASTYVPGGVGGIAGTTIRKGVVLCAASRPSSQRWDSEGGVPEALLERAPDIPVLRATPGPHWKLFAPNDLDRLFGGSLTFSAQSDRTGLRLEGAKLVPRRRPSLASFGMVRGAIQVPPAGNPILLAADAHPMGGYPIVAVVARADFGALAQIQPGEEFRLQLASIEEARAADAERAQNLDAVSQWSNREGIWAALGAIPELAKAMAGRSGEIAASLPGGRMRAVFR